ncbi:MAG: leucyl/phenylalanyl-tRNA--protein transferase [Proteobacteria bacterium]|nr:leucyl/phenylalanyl-tRNA--protein transferase [Pseudomonadota bacterium]
MPIYRLGTELIFPDPAFADPEGLLAVGGDLSPERLLLAYSMGIFPWYSDDQPILWWSPDPRLIVQPEDVHISKSLQRTIKNGKFTVTFDTDFRSVIQHCSEMKRPDQAGTWITEEMIEAYSLLHLKGFAHSVETYLDGKLVGGLYGVSLGKAFFGESMFSTCSDASKVALAALSRKLADWQFDFIDCQVTTQHLVRMGAREISRNDFLDRLNSALYFDTRRGAWH